MISVCTGSFFFFTVSDPSIAVICQVGLEADLTLKTKSHVTQKQKQKTKKDRKCAA